MVVRGSTRPHAQPFSGFSKLFRDLLVIAHIPHLIKAAGNNFAPCV